MIAARTIQQEIASDYSRNQRFVELLEELKSRRIVYNDADFAARVHVNRSYISDIKIENSEGDQVITFTISYQPEEYRKVRFRCSHLLEPDQQNDRLYNIVKNIANRSKVYFDGFIGTRQNGDIIYYGSSPGDRLNISYPDYSFWIVDIGTEKRSDTLSPDMQKAVSLIYEITALVERRYFKRISQEEYDKQSDPLVKSFTALKERMSPNEQWYIQRLTNCLGNRIIDRSL